MKLNKKELADGIRRGRLSVLMQHCNTMAQLNWKDSVVAGMYMRRWSLFLNEMFKLI